MKYVPSMLLFGAGTPLIMHSDMQATLWMFLLGMSCWWLGALCWPKQRARKRRRRPDILERLRNWDHGEDD